MTEIFDAALDSMDFIDIYWEDTDGEFGHIYLYSSASSGKIIIDSEHMSKKFVKKVFNKLVDIAELKD